MDNSPVSNPFDADDKANSRTILLVSIALLGLCCCVAAVGAFFWFKPDPQALIAQYFPSSTATASATPSQTPTPIATATTTSTPTPNLTATAEILQATDTAAAVQGTATQVADTWRVVMTDPFDSNKNKWTNEASDDEFANVNYQVVDGVYRWDVTTHKSFIGWVRAGKKTYSDFSVSVDARQVSGPDNADFGVVFREDEDGNFYYFGINNQGQYALYEYAGEWNTLIDWTDSDLINAGETNRITVIAQGTEFTFFINDQYLTSIIDEHISKGSIALSIEMAQENDEGVFEFDNFELRTP
ncbi:MAG: DUF1080 domain-containing protein [Anaerolineales bacterium]